MDPATTVDKIVHETALDGIYGMQEDRLWTILDNWLPQPLDSGLKTAIWQWISKHPDITIETSQETPQKHTLFASTNMQWVNLTGAPPLDNPIGEKVFEVLNLIAHCRHEGITTVQISKRTGQDSRLLFGRIQTLINHGLVQRFPVIEDGAATNKMFFHSFVSQRDALSTENDQTAAQSIDKNTLYRLITDYSQSGPQHMRLVRAIVELASQRWPATKKSRIRRIVSYAINELEQQKCVRRVAVVDPDRPDVHYQCVEYRKDPPDNSTNSAGSSTMTGVVDKDGLIAAVDQDEDEDEDQEAADGLEDLNFMKTEFDRVLSNNCAKSSDAKAAEEDKVHRANLVFPLVNQIYDRVRESSKNGISTMELNHSLTGTKYRRTLAKYLEMLTASNSKGTALKPKELNYLDLVKGVDFNRRIKYYRYFTKMAYSDSEASVEEQRWGEFLQDELNSLPPKSLLELEKEMFNPPRLNCMIVKTKDGLLKPIFRGDMSLGVDVEIVLKSDPGPSNPAQPAKKRGRPRKNPLPESSLPPPTKPQKIDDTNPVEQLKRDLAKHIIPMNERKWVGGHASKESQPSVYLSLPEQLSDRAEKNAAVVAEEPKQGANAETQGNGAGSDAMQIDLEESGPSKDKAVESEIVMETIKLENGEVENGRSGEPKIASLAFQQRIDRFLTILSDQKGVVQGGTWLINKFSENWRAKVTIDRRTMSRVVNKLISTDHLRQISFNVPTPTGKISLKTIYYDPQTVKDPESDMRIQEIKTSIINRNSRDSSSMAARVASALAKARANVPVKEVTQEQLDVLRPRIAALPGRIMTAGGSGGRVSTKTKMKYGPSAAEVLGVDKNGEPKSKSKRSKRDMTPLIEKRKQKRDRNVLTSEEQKQRQLQELQNSLSQIRRLDVYGQDRDAMDVTDEQQYEHQQVKASSWPLDLDVLARRVIVYKSLTPRRGAAIDWKVVVNGLPGLSVSEAQRLWPEVRRHMSEMSLLTLGSVLPSADIVMSRIEKFENMFVEAYQRGDIQQPDVSDLRKTVPALAEWWLGAEIKENERLLSNEAAARANPSVRIEQVTRHLKSLKLKSKGQPTNIDPLASLQYAGSVVNAEKLLLDTPFSVPTSSSSSLEYANSDSKSPRFSDAELRVRAVIAADSGSSFDPALATEELSGLTNDEVTAARSGLERKRVIQWAESDTAKTPTGRPYVLHDLVLAALSTPKLNSEIFIQAAQSINEVLTKKEFSMKALPTIEDDQMVMLLEILTGNRGAAHIKRTGEKFGMISEDYKSRDIDKQAFECDLEVVFKNLHPENHFGSVKVPVSANASRPYIWQTKLLSSRNVWSKVLSKIFSTVLFRPNILLINIALAVQIALEFVEVEAAVNAMVSANVFVYKNNGYSVSPQWYLNLKPE